VADEQESGERTEQPTPKKLRDARERGDVSRSKDIGATAGLLMFVVVGALLAGYAGSRIVALFEQAIAAIDRPFETASAEMIVAAGWTVIALTLAVAIPVALFGLLADFLQIGPVFTGKKLEPKMENLDPVKGIKRMFSMDNLFELAKSVVKTLVLLAIAIAVSKALLPQLATLPNGSPGAFGDALQAGWVRMVAWTLAIFTVIAVADALYQRYAYIKKLRMSMREIRREFKEEEGDPLLKQYRRQQHEELGSESATQAAGDAHMLVVNPTHVAIALDYDPKRQPVPTVTAKGEDEVALQMREAAREAGVPMLRDVALARALLERAPVGEIVPDDLFEAVAHAVVWARTARARSAGRGGRSRERPDRMAQEAGVSPAGAAARRGRSNERRPTADAAGPTGTGPTGPQRAAAEPTATGGRPKRPPEPPS
jgi:type III secretion protein U